jgi:hypothetical protein
MKNMKPAAVFTFSRRSRERATNRHPGGLEQPLRRERGGQAFRYRLIDCL